MAIKMFLKQLMVLLQKNAIVKRRQPVFLMLELLWPIFLFGAILGPLRGMFKPEEIKESYYRATALPSAGLLPFVQSVVCDLSGVKVSNSSDMPDFPNASATSLYGILDDVASWNGSWDNICSALRSTVQISDSCASALGRDIDAQQALGLLPSNPEEILPKDCSALRQHYEEVNKLLALNEFTVLYPKLANTSLHGNQTTFQHFLCGNLKVSSTAVQFLNDRVFLGDKTQQAIKARNSTLSEVRAKRQSNAQESSTAKQLPLRTAPKVLYYVEPQYAALAMSIIKRANRTIESVEYVRNWATQVLNCSQYFLDHFPPNSPQVVQVQEVLGLFNDSNSFRAKQLLDPSYPQNVWSLVQSAADISQEVLSLIATFDWEVFMPVSTEAMMEQLAGDYNLQEAMNITTVLGGVVMENFVLDGQGHLQHVDIRIRLNSTYVPQTDVLRQPVFIPGPESGFTKRLYILGGFMFIQDILERAAMEEILEHTLTSPGVYLHQMPYPCYYRDLFTDSMIVVLPITMTLAWMFSVAITVRAIVQEKEQRLKEVMRMMGLTDGALRLSWYITSFILFFLSASFIAIILKVTLIVPATNGLILWLFLVLYACSLISFCFLVSVFFSSANLAACISALVYFMFFFAEITVIAKQKYLSAGWIATFSLSAPVAFSVGTSYIMQYEILRTGTHWANVNISPVQEAHFTLLGVCGMLVLDTVLYYVLAWYLENVFPGKYGVAKPPHFFLQPSFWLGHEWHSANVQRRKVQSTDNIEMKPLTLGEETESCCEHEPGLEMGINIQKLSKVYSIGCLCSKKHVQALKDFSLKFYEGQITALLGHNGAGKTTTMSLLTGLFEPSSGTACIYGNDIRTEMDVIRQSLGVCPQFNVLFDSLTVEEHMMFYGRLKGMEKAEIRRQIPVWLKKINLSSHAKTLSRHLSGGMKRKLSIMMAFLGDPRTVILDEPTAGVDPYARRQIWDFLCRHRIGHTIILSTHHMDEAEILGDRIAIIANGRLLCCGSFEYLKRKFGRGHHLVLVRSSKTCTKSSEDSAEHLLLDDMGNNKGEAPQDNELSSSALDTPFQPVMPVVTNGNTLDISDGNFGQLEGVSSEKTLDHQLITTFIQAIIPGTMLEECRGQELHYLLPLKQAQPLVLAELFQKLETSKNLLCISSYGLTSCSLDEIFVDLTEHKSRQLSCIRESAFQHSSDQELFFANMHTTDLETSEHGDCYNQNQTSDHQESQLPVCTHISALNGENQLVTTTEVTESPPSTIGTGTSVSSDSGGNGVLSTSQMKTKSNDVSVTCEEHKAQAQKKPTLGQRNLTGCCLYLFQFHALLAKRFLYTKRKLRALFIQNVLPLLVVITSLTITFILLDVVNPPPLQLSPSLFLKEGTENYAFVAGIHNKATRPYITSLLEPCGLGSSLLGTSPINVSQCHATALGQSCDHLIPSIGSCKCTSCSSVGTVSQPNCYDSLPSGSRILDLSTYQDNIAEYYDNLTNYFLQTEDTFVQKRYGGVSFGHERPEVSAFLDQYYSLYPNTSLPFAAVRAAAKVWYSNKGYHAAPTYLNTLNNAILRAHLDPWKDPAVYGVRTFNHPFPTTDLQKLQYAVLELGASIVNPLGAVFAVGFITAGVVLLIIDERSANVKHLQVSCGLNRVVYWLSLFVWDICAYTLLTVVIVALYLAFQDPSYTSTETLPIFVLLLISYGFAVVPWMYVLSFLFQSAATGYILLFCLNFFSGFSLLIVDVIIAFVTEARTINYYLIYTPFPAYMLGRGMVYLNLDRVIKKTVATLTGETVPTPMTDLWPFFVSLWVQACLYIFLVLCFEFIPLWLKRFQRSGWTPKTSLALATNDPLVTAERDRVLTGDCSNDVLVVRELTKRYRTTQSLQYHLAVNQLCFGLHRGECFGLLGVNGAGKTTIFRMLTADLHPSFGDALLNGYSIVKETSHVLASMGYCPQVDALINELTGREHLTLIGRLRGLSQPAVNEVVEWALTKLGLLSYADKPAGTYSGGNRRKLSTAIALLTKPPVVFLDEPTTGVDPHARHFLWDIVRDVTSSGQSILLTTHSMAECEALCSRVGIMVNGSFQCMGTPQQLKCLYGGGYRVKIRTKGHANSMKMFMEGNLHQAALKEKHFNTLIYQLPTSDGHDLCKLVEVLERARDIADIDDYSISQTTLDDVFIHFANQQSDHYNDLSSANAGDGDSDNVAKRANDNAALT